MSQITVSDTHDYLLQNGKGFFYLADTVWSAFTNASPDEWEEYLEYRRKQGFNALQINILPQWDRSRAEASEPWLSPFGTDDEGNIDFYSMNEEYFSKAAKMTEMAVNKGFIPALVLLWGDYVENPWACSLNPCRVFPIDAVKPYVEYVIKIFSPFNPIYLVSGDIEFKYESTHQYFLRALEVVKCVCPNAITTLHIFGEESSLPEAFQYSGCLDMYMYQSGHNRDDIRAKTAYKLALDFLGKDRKRPVINGEPCYEGMGFSNVYGRFGAFDVRKAIWQSLLSGAKAGVTYGAHGLWSWHNRDNYFVSTECFDTPFEWRTALRLPGAWDAAFAKWVFDNYNLFDIEPASIVLNNTEEIRASISKDGKTIVVYIPYNTEVKTSMNLSGYDLTLIALEGRFFGKPTIKNTDESTIIKMHDFNCDVLIIGRYYDEKE